MQTGSESNRGEKTEARDSGYPSSGGAGDVREKRCHHAEPSFWVKIHQQLPDLRWTYECDRRFLEIRQSVLAIYMKRGRFKKRVKVC
jgi:hypothetical protein